jgi:glucose-6-phosphate 1-dehydrogenase
MAGDRSLFAREDYVEEAWRIVDPMLKAKIPVNPYAPGTWGPSQMLAPPGGWLDAATAPAAAQPKPTTESKPNSQSK